MSDTPRDRLARVMADHSGHTEPQSYHWATADMLLPLVDALVREAVEAERDRIMQGVERLPREAVIDGQLERHHRGAVVRLDAVLSVVRGEAS